MQFRRIRFFGEMANYDFQHKYFLIRAVEPRLSDSSPNDPTHSFGLILIILDDSLRHISRPTCIKVS